MEQQAINNHINQLDPIRFKADLLNLAIAGMQSTEISPPDDALASMRWFANGISVELTNAIERMENGAKPA